MSPNETDAANPPETKGGVIREWVIPIVAGLAIGALLVLGWKHGRDLLRSDAEKLVRQWTYLEFDANDELETKIRALGKDARADLLQAFRRVEVPPNSDGDDEYKVWVAQLLAGDPFFDTRSLVEIVKDPSAPVWDRRAAAAALTHTLQKDVDPTAVTPVLLAWLEDLSLQTHTIAMTSVRQLRSDSVFPPDMEGRLRDAMLRLASRSARPEPAEEMDLIRLRTDREWSVRFVGSFLAEDAVKSAVWQIASDETDEVHVRAAAVQTLASNQQFADVAPWKKLAQSEDVVVRQTVAENLAACPDPAFDAVLAPLHTDAGVFVRKGSVESQVQRNRPTMLAVMDLLLEDSDVYVRQESLIACGVFKSHLDGMGARQGMILRLLETSDVDEDVEGAILALNMITGQSFGFAAGDVDAANRTVAPNAIAAFKSDAEGRRDALAKWRKHLGGTAVWTDADRRKTLEKLLVHADPDNQARAKSELAKLAGGK